MSLPDPFNSVEALVAFTSFKQGGDAGADSVREGTFRFEQFTRALQDARIEIFRRTGERENSEFSEARLYQLAAAERYLATANLYPLFGERISTAFPESNLQGVGEVMSGGICAALKSVKNGERWNANAVLTNWISQGQLAV